jgi:hypothetical protein
LTVGLLLIALGLALFSRAPADAGFIADVLPGMLLQGIGTGLTSTPLLSAGLSGTDGRTSGIVSGILNTVFLMGGALGVATLPHLIDLREDLPQNGAALASSSLLDGFHLAFQLAAVCLAVAALIATFLRTETNTSCEELGSPRFRAKDPRNSVRPKSGA